MTPSWSVWSNASGQPPTRGLIDAEHFRLLIEKVPERIERADNLDAGEHFVPADQTLGDGTVLHQRVGFAGRGEPIEWDGAYWT